MRKKLEAAAEAARKQLNKQFSEDAPLPEGTPLSKETAKVGQTVFLPSLRQNGTIVAVNGGDVTVQVGILKTNVPAKNCLLVKGKTKVSEDLRPKKRKGVCP
ncbi:MutS2/Smr-associated SH3 domain-containing protein [Phascolarctobacterium faecium]|uniref:MutS2/Smr-associated SH3 domain-containing protein n=1 Tax=Phascolarctobacterium faecium TaxID=33025 RepID=UPI00399BBC5C